MAGCDYYSCDKCGTKTFYDASVDWESYAPRIGKIICICKECAKTFKVVMIPTDIAAIKAELVEKLGLGLNASKYNQDIILTVLQRHLGE